MNPVALPKRGLMVALLALVVCSPQPRDDDPMFGTGGETTGGTTGVGSSTSTTGSTGALDSSGSTGEAEVCDCAPGTDVIHVMSDDGELWSYDPIANAFAMIGPVQCGGFDPFSMAVDREGKAWVLLLDNIAHSTVAKGMFKIDIADAGGCEPVIYEEGLFGVFGTSFVTNGPPDTCEKLYVQSYSGSGPFAEGPDLGHLGVLDDEAGVLTSLGTVDYDGGELAGTGDGRLFSLSGVDPLKLVEFDKETAEPIQILELDGFSKTNASAMAFYGGDFYLFTESANPTCIPCLETACSAELAACQADPECVPVLECLLAGGGEGPGCEGDIVGPGGPLRDCMFDQCATPCAKAGVVSRVTHVDWDESDGAGQAVSVVEEFAPMRIVGAGSSTCVPVSVP